MINYLNTLPFRTVEGIDYHFGVPAELNALFKEKKLDISLISTAAFLDGNYRRLPFGIAAEKEVMSVNLYVRNDCDTLDKKRILLDHESASSNLLLKILCAHFWKVKPHFVHDGEHDAFLLIGDKALSNYTVEGFHRIDLATSWYEHTKLPFVFAVFAYHEDSAEIDQFSKLLDKSLSNFSTIPKHSTFTPELLSSYFSKLIFRLGPKENEGLRLFSSLRRLYV